MQIWTFEGSRFRFSSGTVRHSSAQGDGSLINYQIGALYWLMQKAHLYALAAGLQTIHSKYLKRSICEALYRSNNNQQPAPRSARQQGFPCFNPKQIWHINIEARGPTVPTSAQAATLSTQPEATQGRPKPKWCGRKLSSPFNHEAGIQWSGTLQLNRGKQTDGGCSNHNSKPLPYNMILN